jgi:hypothetical protein
LDDEVPPALAPPVLDDEPPVDAPPLPFAPPLPLSCGGTEALDEHERRRAAEAAAPSTTRVSIQRAIGGLYTKSVLLLDFFGDVAVKWYCLAH